MHVRVSVCGRCGRPWARESRPEVLPWDGNRSRMREVPSGRSVRGYVIPKVGRSASVLLSGRIGRSSTVTEIVTNLKQDRPKQIRWMERQRRYLSFPYSSPCSARGPLSGGFGGCRYQECSRCPRQVCNPVQPGPRIAIGYKHTAFLHMKTRIIVGACIDGI